MLAGTFFATIQQPLWPLITQAIKKKDAKWVRSVHRKLFLAFTTYSLFVLVVVILFGDWAFNTWSNNLLSFNRSELIFVSLYFLTIAINQACIIMLMGYGAFSFIGKCLIMESLLLVLLISTGVFEYTLLGVLKALLLARISTSTVSLFLGVKRKGMNHA